jgi:hypothetical protein
MSLRILLGGLGACWVALVVPAVSGKDRDDLKKDIEQAIKRGVAVLKKKQAEDGGWSYRQATGTGVDITDASLGSTALAGLAVLECGTPATDAAVQKAATYVRKASIESTATYALSLAILFLDRLGEEPDIALIESLTVRLLAGQNNSGGWSYTCPAISKEEKERLAKVIRERDELVKQGEKPKKRDARLRTVRDLPREITDQLVQIGRQGDPLIRQAIPVPQRAATQGDNSNTQFAALALWVSRRLGLPVQNALRRTAERFRLSQTGDGGWAYYPIRDVRATAAMTCAGLLALAFDHGAVNEKAKGKGPRVRLVRDPDKDLAIKRGLATLSTAVGVPVGNNRERIQTLGERAGRTYYFLWSLERVAMSYGLDRIGNKDWYAWGAEIILANEGQSGGWYGSHLGEVDTSFALLFLCRSNLAPDLTAALKGRIKNAGQISLTAGGVGGSSLIKGQSGKGLQPGIGAQPDPHEKSAAPPRKLPALKLSADEQDREITRLSTALVRASGEEQEKLLDKLKESKGVVYTEALAGSIPLLQGEIKARARAALAGRLIRMSAETLRDKLKDDNLEVRRAAALACARKKSRAHVPDLIEVLGDAELPVALAAHQALKDLTGKDFGPDADATRAERKAAVAQWKAWWKKQTK